VFIFTLDLIHGTEVFIDLLLLAIDPSGQDQEVKLPRLQDESHDPLPLPRCFGGKSAASTGGYGLSIGPNVLFEGNGNFNPAQHLQRGWIF